jgi:hypothetical protein
MVYLLCFKMEYRLATSMVTAILLVPTHLTRDIPLLLHTSMCEVHSFCHVR